MVIPCHNCLLKPVCKHKTYINLLDDCNILYDALIRSTSQQTRSRINQPSCTPIILIQLFNALKPTNWHLSHYTTATSNYIQIQKNGISYSENPL